MIIPDSEDCDEQRHDDKEHTDGYNDDNLSLFKLRGGDCNIIHRM